MTRRAKKKGRKKLKCRSRESTRTELKPSGDMRAVFAVSWRCGRLAVEFPPLPFSSFYHRRLRSLGSLRILSDPSFCSISFPSLRSSHASPSKASLYRLLLHSIPPQLPFEAYLVLLFTIVKIHFYKKKII